MRGRARRVVERVAAHIASEEPVSDPRALARLIGVAARARGCELTIASDRHRWGSEDGPWLSHPVWYEREQQGIVALTSTSAHTVRAVAGVLGPTFAALRLAAEADRLRRESDAAARTLADDQWQAAVEMERERRMLERDLHDGAQHHLVALRMALALVEHTGNATPETLADLLNRLDAAERALLDTAAGVLPLSLAEGLTPALTTDLGGHDDVILDLAGLRRRYPLSVESAVYFACLEAVNNAHKHATGARITVSARDIPSGLEFAVADNGPGFAGPIAGSGISNLSTRIEAVGGTIDVHSAPGRGTTVTGFVPR